MKIVNSKKNIILLIVLILSIVILTVSFAYFAVSVAAPANTDVILKTDKNQVLSFTDGEPLSLNPSQFNFVENGDDLITSSTSKVNLKSKKEGESASDTYNVYFQILENSFVYTQEGDVPEVLLKIYDIDGNEMIDLYGPNYVTSTDEITGNVVSGYDITTYQGIIKIKEDQSINTTSTDPGVTQEWKIELIYLNLPGNQSLNVQNKFNAELTFQKEYIDITKGCENKQIASCFSGNVNYSESLTKHDSINSIGASDDNYRFSGNNTVKNFVCFGSDDELCPENNLYRIIGIFDGKIKLIKYTPLDINNDGTINPTFNGTDTYTYDLGNNHLWNESDVNIYLNNEYFNSLNTNYQEMIQSHNFYVGNVSGSFAKSIYDTEKSVVNETENNIGLMYASDYLFAANKQYWGLSYSNYSSIDVKNNNWLYLDLYSDYYEWTMSTNGSSVLYSHYLGNLVYATNEYSLLSIRPTFYLKAETIYKSGRGTSTEPFRIDI